MFAEVSESFHGLTCSRVQFKKYQKIEILLTFFDTLRRNSFDSLFVKTFISRQNKISRKIHGKQKPMYNVYECFIVFIVDKRINSSFCWRASIRCPQSNAGSLGDWESSGIAIMPPGPFFLPSLHYSVFAHTRTGKDTKRVVTLLLLLNEHAFLFQV